MARPAKTTAEYFPHFVSGGKTLHTLEKRYGNDGYAFWFKLLELLCDAEDHYISLDDDATLIYVADRAGMPETQVFEVIGLLVRLGKVDAALWEAEHGIWVQNLVDNLAPLYAKRTSGLPQKPVIAKENAGCIEFPCGKLSENDVSAPETPQSRVEYSKEDNNDDDNTARASDDLSFAAVTQLYSENIHVPTPIEAEQLADFLDDTCREAVEYAIFSAVEKNSRNMGYIKSIINSLYENGVRDNNALQAYIRDWQDKKASKAGRSPPGKKKPRNLDKIFGGA